MDEYELYEERSESMIPGSDVEMSGYQQYEPLPKPGIDYCDPNSWLPKTDWSRDGIIANGQE